jgi:hypothetical protein
VFGFYHEKNEAEAEAEADRSSILENQSKTFDEKTDVKTTFKDGTRRGQIQKLSSF